MNKLRTAFVTAVGLTCLLCSLAAHADSNTLKQ